MANKNFQVKHGLEVGSTVTADAATGNITTSGDVAVNGGDITTTSATATVVNTNATTVNIAGAGTTVAIGANSGTLTIRNPTVVGTQTTQNLYNTVATTLNIGGGATTAVNIGNVSGEIDTPSDVQQLGNKSIRQGDGPYSGSTDIYRTNDGVAVEGFQISNNNMTNADTGLVIRNYGQNISGGSTITASGGRIYMVGSRGTAASPLAINTAQNIAQLFAVSNLGDTTGTGNGAGFTNDLYPSLGQSAGMNINSNQNQRQTLQATFTGSISGTTLTVTAVASGTITPGHELRGTGFAVNNSGYVISGQLTSTEPANALGLTGTYNIAPTGPGTIGSSTMNTYSITAGSAIRFWHQPQNVPISPSTVIGPSFNSAAVTGGIASFPYLNMAITQPFFVHPVATRIITAITGGNTLNIGTHGFTTTGASFTVTTAGNPNGLTTGTTYFIDTIPSSTTVTLRTNSVSGGAVTGLTNGTGLFISATAAAINTTGSQLTSNQLTMTGLRRGQNYAGLSNQDNTRQGDRLGQFSFTGGFSTGGTNTQTQIYGQATQDWSNGVQAGSAVVLQSVKDGTLTAYPTSIGASLTTFRTDALDVTNTGATNLLNLSTAGNLTIAGDLRVNGNDIQASDGNTNITMNSNTLTTFAGNIKINGNSILASDGATNMNMVSNTLTSFGGEVRAGGVLRTNGNTIQNSTGNNAILMATGAAPLITTPGNIQVNGNTIQNSGGNSNIQLGGGTTVIQSNQTRFVHNSNPANNNLYSPNFIPGTPTTQTILSIQGASPLGNQLPLINFQNVRFDGTNVSPTQTGDQLGQYKFNGNTASSGTAPSVPGGPGASITAVANENWTNTANGTNFNFFTIKKGALTDINVLQLASDNIRLRGDQITLQDSNSVALTSAAINYTRTYGEFAYTNAAGFNIPAQNTIYTMPLDTTLNNSGTTISGTGNININVSGWYKIIISLQVTLTVSNQPGQVDFWLRKNGADVPNSKTQIDLLKDQKAVIAMDWLVNSDGNDYWEIVYVGTSANYADIDFPTIAATTTPYVSPVAPALIVNVIPAGM